MIRPVELRPPDPPPFDLRAPLPSGVTLLEASAGTGKTFTIAALAVRFVAAGVPLDRMLVVTFTRLATGELRERVRERLLSAGEGLGRVLSGAPAEKGDELVEIIADCDRPELLARHALISRALAEFDAATIDTTHGFCMQVLRGLGVAGDFDPGSALVENVEDMLDEVVDDLYVRKFFAGEKRRPFGPAEARRIAATVLGNPGVHVLPELSSEGTDAAMRRRLVKAVAEEVERRKRAARVLTYDDLLTRLRDTLAHPLRGEAACARLRDRYRVVLVDEFQDTDPVQWEILRRAFVEPGTTLVLIGDPKQAIYAFRGADVYAYLDAARTADSESTLPVNRRSDQGLLDALNALFDGCQLGHPGIVHRRVQAAPENVAARLEGAPDPTPLRFRVLDRQTVEQTARHFAGVKGARPAIASDLAREVAGLLASTAEVVRRASDGSEQERRALYPGDLAVLVRTNKQAALVRDALVNAAIPAVLGGGGSVFATAPAEEWRRLLEALESPTSRERAASATLTRFIGWTAAQVASADEPAWEQLHQQLHRWASLLQRRGVATLFEAVSSGTQLPARVLATLGGERFLTDMRHVGQLLHRAATEDGLGPAALLSWLRRRIKEAERDVDDLDRSLRLETDAQAVQVLTVHRSKGLEFPVVFCPFLWDHWSPQENRGVLPVFHDPESAFERTIDVSGDGPGFDRHLELHTEEERGEDLRLLYVAVTRARHQVVIWWAGSSSAGSSALGRLLFARDAAGLVAKDGPSTPTDSDTVRRLVALVEPSGGNLSVEMFGAGGGIAADATSAGAGGTASVLARPRPADIAAAEFARSIDATWRRLSFSSITARSHVPFVGSEHEEVVAADESGTNAAAGLVGADGGSEPGAGEAVGEGALLLGPMPGGVRIGTLVHSLLEETDFAAEDLSGTLRAGLRDQLAQNPIPVGDFESVVDGLRAAIEAPLGPLAGGLRLRDFARADRVDEMTFELPLTGGDRSTAELSIHDVAEALRAHLPAADPLARYAERLADPTLERSLRGYLTGSLDLVLRLPGPRFLIADYKTNRLASDDQALSALHYRPEAVEAEMLQAHYPLQALLYTVALHRYLRWRVPDYDTERHLGGVLYLFLRGMSDAAPPPDGNPRGVWSWRPPASAVEAISDLFDRGPEPPAPAPASAGSS